MARTPKLDAVLADARDAAREALSRHVPDAQVGEHLGVSAEGERLVLHRFEAKVRGYAGWHWYVTLARGPRVKVVTVCDSGLLPGEHALLAPDWVPWADRVAPEELAEEQAREAAEAATPAGENSDTSADAADQGDAVQAADTVQAAEDDDDAAEPAVESAAPAAGGQEDASAATADAAAEGSDDETENDGDATGRTRPRRRRRARRRTR